MADQSNKTEQPTTRRVEKARKEGQFLVSKELVSSIQFLTFVALATGWSEEWLAAVRQTARTVLERAMHSELDTAETVRLAWLLGSRVLAPLGVAALILLAVTMAVQLAITGGGTSGKRLSPQLKFLNPLNRLRELPRQNMATLIQSVIVLVVFGISIYAYSAANIEAFLSLPLYPLRAGLYLFRESIWDLLKKAAALFLVLGLVDLFRQYRRYRKELRMSKQDIRDELRESEGNPQTRARLRRLQREMRRRRMMQDVATATAVVVNPTHYAVALKYGPDSQGAPLVVAKGKNYLALRIRQRAVENHIPLVENPPLAQALYKSVDVGREIPPSLYRAVAEILAYIHRLTSWKR